MLQKLEKLIDVWTNLGEALLVQTQKENGNTAPAPEKKPRASKKAEAEAPAPVAPAANPVAPQAVDAAAEAKSLTEAQNAAQAVCLKFPTLVGGKPEGFHKAKKLLADEFAGSTFAKLDHAARLKFTARIKEIIAGAAAPQTAGATDL